MKPPEPAILPRNAREFRQNSRWVQNGSNKPRKPPKTRVHQVRRAKTNQRDSKSESNYEPEGREFESPRAHHFPFKNDVFRKSVRFGGGSV
jgi:hypothetical protein